MSKMCQRTLSALAIVGLLVLCACSPSSKKASHFARAEKYLKNGKREAALIEYMNVLRLDFNNAPAIARIGEIYVARGESRRAFPYLQKAQELDPTNIKVRVMLSRFYLGARKLKTAREEASAVLQTDPGNEEAMLVLAEAATAKEDIEAVRQQLQKLKEQVGDKAAMHVALGYLFFREQNSGEAEREFKEARAMDPQFAPALSGLASVYWARNAVQEADAAFSKAAELSLEKSFTLLRHADFKDKTGQSEEAKRIIDSITQTDPEFLPAWISKAEAAFKAKQFDECLALVKKVLDRDGFCYEAQLLRARLSVVKGDVPAAIDYLETLAGQYPAAAQVPFVLAGIFADKGDMDQAITRLEKAVAIDPGFLDAILALADARIRKGNALAAIPPLAKLLKERPTVARAYLLLADAHRKRGALDDALAVYERYMAQFPKDPQGPYLAGTTLRSQNGGAKAREFFEKALALAPDHLLAISHLVEMDVLEKNFASAMVRARKAVEINPKSLLPRILLAKIYLAQNDFGQAEAALVKAIEADPNSSQGYALLARLYLSFNKPKEGLERLEQSVARNPGDYQSWMQIAMIADSNANYEKAAESYGKVLAINPNFGPALNNAAYLHAERLGQIDKAYEFAKRARDLLPFDPYTADTFGWILFRRGQYPRALGLLKQSADQLGSDPEILSHLGAIQYMIADEEGARRSLSLALQLSPKFVGRIEAEQRLAILNLDPAEADQTTIAALEKASADRPNDPIVSLRLGAIAERSGKLDQAVAAYEKVLQSSPSALPALLRLARIYSTRPADQDRAMELASNLRNLAPNDPAAAEILGKLSYAKGDFQRALVLLKESANGQPDRPEVLHALALSQYAVGQVRQALETMKKGIETRAEFPAAAEANRFVETVGLCLEPGDPLAAYKRAEALLKADPEYLPALMLSAISQEKGGKSPLAQRIYERILVRYPLFAPALLGLAKYYEEKDDKKVLELVGKARSLLPGDPQVTKALGVANFRLAEFPNASLYLSECASKLPNDPEVFYYLGMTQYRLRRISESRNSLKKAVGMPLQANLTKEAERVLAELK